MNEIQNLFTSPQKTTHTISEICVNCKTYTKKRKIVTTKVTFFLQLCNN